jgi:hypothetical protein
MFGKNVPKRDQFIMVSGGVKLLSHLFVTSGRDFHILPDLGSIFSALHRYLTKTGAPPGIKRGFKIASPISPNINKLYEFSIL